MLKGAVALILAVTTCTIRAQGFPNKPVLVVVPFAPGGSADVLGRVLAPQLGENLGQSVVVENRAGASGAIGTVFVVKAPANGYTLLLGSTATIATPILSRNAQYDPVKDLQPILRLTLLPKALIVHPAVPAKSVRELIALAKAEPGKLSYASAGVGSAQHLAGELFQHMSGTEFLHVPYKGGGPAMQDLIAGRISMTIEPLNTALPRIRSGQVRALAVSTADRVSALPELPTIAETVPGYQDTLWFGLFGPAGMPREAVNVIHAATIKTLRTPEIRDRIAEQGVELIGDSVEEFAETVRRESSTWAEFSKKTGLKLD